MTTQTLTLADFLLARIAEDEVGYGQMHETLRVAATRVTEGRSTVTTSETVLHRSKMLAECEAKRRIVEAHARYERSGAPEVEGAKRGLMMAIRYLAISYADDPDYREEWRP